MAREPWLPGEADEEPGSLYRPYTITRGRTRPASDEEIEFETLVWTSAIAEFSMATASVHWRAVTELCREVLSLAEVAARLGVPIGTARVLIGDMAEAGLLHLQRPRHAGEGSEIALLKRVLYGLQQL